MTVKVQRKIQNAEIENECDSSQSHVQEPQGFLPTHPIPVAKGSARHRQEGHWDIREVTSSLPLFSAALELSSQGQAPPGRAREFMLSLP